MLESILQLDVKTLMVVLLLGNLVSVALIVSYYCTETSDLSIGKQYLPAKLFQAAAYFLLLYRSQISDFSSVYLGNCFLMFGFYLEALTMMTIIQEFRSMVYPLTGIMIVSCTIFCLSEYFYHDPSIRVACSSLCVFMIFFLPNIRMLVSRNTTFFKQSVGFFYLLFMIILLPRAYFALTHDMNILTNSLIQVLTFMSQVLLLIFSLSAYLLLIKEQSDRVINVMANTDYLTGLLNRYRFMEAAERAFERCRFDGKSAAVVFFDIDYFKAINDSYGHAFGDMVLMVLGKIVRDSVRPTDLCCRYGGEEFVIFLPDATKLTANKVAERIRSMIAEKEFEDHPGFSYTISVGIMDAVPQPGDSLELYVSQADAAMYAAKKSGRDQIMEYDPMLNFMWDGH